MAAIYRIRFSIILINIKCDDRSKYIFLMSSPNLEFYYLWSLGCAYLINKNDDSSELYF